MSELNIKSISQGIDGSLITTTLDDYSFFLPEGGTMDKGEFDGLHIKAKEHGVSEGRVIEFLINLANHFRTTLPSDKPELTPLDPMLGYVPADFKYVSDQPYTSKELRGLFITDNNGEVAWLDTEGGVEKAIDHIIQMYAERGLTREKAKELISTMITNYSDCNINKGPIFTFDSVPTTEPWVNLIDECMEHVLEGPAQEAQRAEEPDYGPGSMNGDGRRKLNTTKSGFTFPEPKRRR